VHSMLDVCPLCERKKSDGMDFCSLHDAAFTNLENAFTIWSTAFGGLSKDDYFSKLVQLSETGESVKNVIQHIRRCKSAVK
jgi:hypothetical protein